MNYLTQNSPYPVHVLPPMLQDFAQQVVAATQSSYEMVVPVMLTAMSAAVQGVADVKVPYGEVLPVSLFSCVIAKSGDRKSSVLKKVMKGFEDFERGRFSDIPMEGLKSHQFLIEAATNKGVIDIFKGGAYSLFYALDEAALLFKNLDMPSLCKRFDGSAINEVTRSQGSTILHDRHVALCMMTQDITFERFLSKKGELFVQSGLMPRMLISQAISGINSSRWVERLNEEDLARHAFHLRVKELMKEYARSIGKSEISRQHIGFNSEAADLWNQYHLQTKKISEPYENWSEMRSFISRSGELICRVAAVIQYFVEPNQDVKGWIIKAATDIVVWHLDEAKRIFGNGKDEVKFFQEVDGLYSYLLKRFQRTGNCFITRSEILRCGPQSIRKADILDASIDNLIYQGKILKYFHGGRRYFRLNNFPHLF
ncbi:DUF3987 domain-containing protein [Comamonas fluminis]|uniref:DUF3987 domain-containing protein n=1 Tax=Comamonas fluminis TaxID=2796366 RepID=UPI001C47B657|nr:DUF3987 domain-containing protein [Comamonas fluminis]